MTAQLDLKRVAAAGEDLYDESQLARGIGPLEARIRKGRRTRAAGPAALALAALALAAAQLMQAAPPTADELPFTGRIPPVESTVVAILADRLIPWDGESPGQRLAICERAANPRANVDVPIGWNGDVSRTTTSLAENGALTCEHMVLPGENVIAATARVDLNSTTQQASVQFTITNLTASTLQINGVSPTAIVFLPGARSGSTLMGFGGEPASRGWNVVVVSDDVVPFDPYLPHIIGDSNRALDAGETSTFTFLERDHSSTQFRESRLRPFIPWLAAALATPELIEISVSVQLARGYVPGVEEATLFELNVGEVYVDGAPV